MPLLCCRLVRNVRHIKDFCVVANREEAPVLPVGCSNLRFRRMSPKGQVTGERAPLVAATSEVGRAS